MQTLFLNNRFIRQSVIIGALLLAPLLGIVIFQHNQETPSPESLRETATAAPLNNVLASQPLRFIENQGQAGADVRFHVEGAGHTVLFSANAVRFRRSRGDESAFKTAQMTLKFAGAAADPQLAGLNRLPGTSNFYRGSDPARWQTQVPAFAEVRYTALYPGVDLVYLGTNGKLKSEFHLAAGADPRVIRLVYDGVQGLHIDEKGNLLLTTALGEVTEARPEIYQFIAGEKAAVTGVYELLDDHTVGFKLGHYDPAIPLVIDPEFAYLSYLGGSGFDSISTLDVNSAGNLFVAGVTYSNDFPTANAFQNQITGGLGDFFVTRIDTSTGTPVYSTFLGGSGDEGSVKLVVDGADNVYLVGDTKSTDFPTLNALQATSGGGSRDVVIARLAADGSLLFSTYFGGDSTDFGRGLDLDADGNLWLAGTTESTNFPTTADALRDTSAGGRDAFVSKLAADGSALLYSTYLGGNASDSGSDLAVDAQGDVYVAGVTRSNDFAGTPVVENAAFVAKLTTGAQTISLDGICIADGSGFDSANSLAVDDRYVFFSGSAGPGLPTTSGAQQPDEAGGGDGMFGACLKQTMAIAYLSYLGTPGFDLVTDFALQSTSTTGNAAGKGALNKTDPASADANAGNNGYSAEVKIALTISAATELSQIFHFLLFERAPGDLSASDQLTLLNTFTNVFLTVVSLSNSTCWFGGSTSDPTLTTTGNAVQTTLAGGSDGLIGSSPRPQGAPKLEIEKIIIGGNNFFDIGEIVNFKVTVRNTGSATATDVVVKDIFFVGVARLLPASVEPPCNFKNTSTTYNEIDCNYSTLAPGEQRVITYATMAIAEKDSSTNSVQATDASGDSVSANVKFNIAPTFIDLFFVGTIFGPDRTGSQEAKLNAVSNLDVYVDSVRVVDDLSALTGTRIQAPLSRAAPLIDLVNGADQDNSNPLASFTVDLVTDDNGNLTFSPSNMFIIAPAANDSLTLLVKQNARTQASDAANVELIIANVAALAGELDFRVAGNGIDQTLPNIGFGGFSDYVGGMPGSYDIEVLQTSDGTSLGTYRFALDAFQGQIVTLLATPADSGANANLLSSAGQAAITLVAFDSSGAVVSGANVTSVADEKLIPRTFALQQNYPNPFNPTTTIRYDLPAQVQVRLTIFDVLGRTVRTLISQKQSAGAHSVVWNGRDDRGRQAASGLYFYRLVAGDFRKTAKMLLLK